MPGLIQLGYDPSDAYEYTVAACWEFIVPNCGADIPNITLMDFPNVVNRVITEQFPKCPDFETLLEEVRKRIADECERLMKYCSPSGERPIWEQSPLLSVFVDGCIETLTDAWDGGAKYCNFGCYGAGIANAADALAAVKMTVYDREQILAQELLQALENDFAGYSEIRNLLKNCPKMGDNDEYVDEIASFLMDVFVETLNGKPNGYGGIWRAGTGSAQGYMQNGLRCPATADGRKSGDPYSSSFSPSLDVKPDGLLSVISSFTKYDLTKIINGGPLTIEVHDTVFRNDIGIVKTAALVKSFVELGGHQLQINSVNRETLLNAQKHPEKYPNLIVRVWGWSGYFNELNPEYHNHVIRRCEYQSF